MPFGACMASSESIEPLTTTVCDTCCGTTISRMPLGSVVSTGLNVEAGTPTFAKAACAHSGSGS